MNVRELSAWKEIALQLMGRSVGRMQQLKAATWFDLVWLFGLPTILNYLASQIAIPYLESKDVLPIEVAYFLSVGLLVLVPMFFGAIYLSGQDSGSYKVKDLLARMRIKKLFWHGSRLDGGDVHSPGLDIFCYSENRHAKTRYGCNAILFSKYATKR